MNMKMIKHNEMVNLSHNTLSNPIPLSKFIHENEKLKKCIDHVIACCVSAGKKVSLMVHTNNQYKFYKNKGVAGFVHAVESFKIKSYFNDSLNSFKR